MISPEVVSIFEPVLNTSLPAHVKLSALVFEQIDELQNVIEKIQEEAEKNNLMSEKLIEKYDQFQDLLTTIINPLPDFNV